MLLLSQAASSTLLAKALEAAGGRIERGVRLADVTPQRYQVDVTLERSGEERAVMRVPWLLAADGAHSAARHALALPFPGSTFRAAWHLADAPLHTPLSPEYAHVFFMERGAFLFLIRVVDPSPAYQASAPVWRIMGNRPLPLHWLPLAEPADAPLWESSFHIAHRIVRRFAVNGVYFAGDAAHVHSPVGARGMNLGIEDAWVFAQLAAAGQFERYGALAPARRSPRRAHGRSAFARGGGGAGAVRPRAPIPISARDPRALRAPADDRERDRARPSGAGGTPRAHARWAGGRRLSGDWT